MQIILKIDSSRAQALLADMLAKGRNTAPLMRSISGIMADAVEENFAQQGRPKWPSLAEATKNQRAKKGHWPGSILQVSGQLAASVSRKYGKDFAQVGTNKVYAAIHQLGGKAGRGKKVSIPARPFLKLGEDDIGDAVELLERHLTPKNPG